MHVHVCLANHVGLGLETVWDQLVWVVSGLEENGHSITISETSLDPDHLNLFWECFPPQFGRYLAGQKFQYGIIATEVPDGSGFNNRRDGDWVPRWNGFRLAASNARFIWPLVHTAVDDYRRFAPSAYLELGFTERLLHRETRDAPKFDFSFAGFPGEHRRQMLSRLSERASVRYADTLLNHTDQLMLLREGRVGLALKHSPNWAWASPARVGRLVHERIPVAQEWVPINIGVTDLVPMPTQDEDFVDWAIALRDHDLEGDAERLLEAYRQTPMRECIARAMDLTL
jgi:hypothetical protein